MEVLSSLFIASLGTWGIMDYFDLFDGVYIGGFIFFMLYGFALNDAASSGRFNSVEKDTNSDAWHHHECSKMTYSHHDIDQEKMRLVPDKKLRDYLDATDGWGNRFK